MQAAAAAAVPTSASASEDGAGGVVKKKSKKKEKVPTIRKSCDFCNMRKKKCDGDGVNRCRCVGINRAKAGVPIFALHEELFSPLRFSVFNAPSVSMQPSVNWPSNSLSPPCGPIPHAVP